MKIEFSAKNYNAPDKLKTVITKKLERLDKYFEGHEVKSKVLMRQDKERMTLEITVYALNVIRSEVSGLNMYDIIDQIMPKLERQIVKYRSRPHSRYKKRVKAEELEYFTGELPKDEAQKIVRTKQFELQPTTVDEAIEQLELLDHNFYIYLDKTSREVCVAYRRMDGQYGVIETKIQG